MIEDECIIIAFVIINDVLYSRNFFVSTSHFILTKFDSHCLDFHMQNVYYSCSNKYVLFFCTYVAS